MDYIDQLKDLADKLDRRGFIKQANLLDKYLYRLAQTAPALPPLDAPPAGEATEQAPALPPLPSAAPAPQGEKKEDKRETLEKMARTTFLMLSELRDFFTKNLPDFKYLGEENIRTLQTALDQLVSMYRVVLRNMTNKRNEELVQSYSAHVKNLQQEVDRSKKMKLTPTKVKIDKFLLFNEFEGIVNKIERHYDSGMHELQPVLKKARAVKDAFANVIQQTSEQIAHADLIETR